VTSGTVFHGSRMPLGLWFRAIWWMTNQKQGVSALGLKRALGLGSYHTAWLMLQKLRRSMVRPGRDLLTGEVEVDETFLGAPKPGKPGRGAEGKELVVIAVEVNEKKIGRVRMNWVPDASGPTLLGFVERNVKSGSLIITDGWKSYNGLSKKGYKHRRIPGESVGIAELLPHVHRIAGLLKRWILGTLHGGIDKQKHIDRYLNEYVFRFNRRTSGSRGLLFYRLIENAVAIDGESYKKITRR
jgi:transposase-like protein